jgi:hypothetical protein
MPDQLSSLYSEFLEGGYDCVDRVVLNAYFSMGQSGGGFRVWWRELYGSDENLDDNHLMRMAGRFSRRLRAWAKANSVPVIYCSPGEDKHKMGEQHLATHEGGTSGTPLKVAAPRNPLYDAFLRLTIAALEGVRVSNSLMRTGINL